MKVTKDDLSALMELIEQADEFKPLLKKAVVILMDYSKEFKCIFDEFTDYMTTNKIKMIHRYMEEGFTKKESILLTMDSRLAMNKMLSNFKK